MEGEHPLTAKLRMHSPNVAFFLSLLVIVSEKGLASVIPILVGLVTFPVFLFFYRSVKEYRELRNIPVSTPLGVVNHLNKGDHNPSWEKNT